MYKRPHRIRAAKVIADLSNTVTKQVSLSIIFKAEVSVKICSLVGRSSSICVMTDVCTEVNQEHVRSCTATTLMGSELSMFCIGLKSFKNEPATWVNIQNNL